jgi:hypothetical protein
VTRAPSHGDYADTARIAQQFKTVIMAGVANRARKGLEPLTATQRESLDLIATKVARILAGDPAFDDHWKDIEGYARIAERH